MTRVRDVFALGWPMLVGQLAVLGNGVIDTIMAGQRSAADLAVVGLGAAIYVSIFVALRGVLTGLAPVVAGHYGAGRLGEIGDDLGQGLWVAVVLAIFGLPLLLWTDPWISLIQPDAALIDPLRGYLWVTAIALPGTLLFSIFFTLNSATSRPAVTMTINLVALALKWPLNLMFMDGVEGLIPAMGAVGCAVSTALLTWGGVLAAVIILAVDRRYRAFHIRLERVKPKKILELFRIGIPIGLGYLIEVTSFTLMALLIGRFGTIASASHQVAANLSVLAFMCPLALGSATSVLAAQALGAGDAAKAKAWVFSGIRLVMGIALGVCIMLFVFAEPLARIYAEDREVQAYAVTLISIAAICHLLDALQCLIYSSLRAWRITFGPMLVYGVSLWGFGVGGGWWIANHLFDPTPSATQGFWIGNFLGLLMACVGLAYLLRRCLVNPAATVKP
jgi:multidrug resistance protein, MATE family